MSPQSPPPSPIVIEGDSITALALAARLARHGHQVVIVAPAHGEPQWGGRLAPRSQSIEGQLLELDDVAPITTLPAAWRDLMKKSGQPMAGFLNAAGLELIEATPAKHRFPDGTEVSLPADRGGQVKALTTVMGRPAALAWAELIDQADELWQAMRFSGAERPFDATVTMAGLKPEQTMGDWADRLPDERLRALWLSEASRAGATRPDKSPALLGSRWSMQRTFGRWQVRGADGGARGLSALIPPLCDRVRAAGVHLVSADTEQVPTPVVTTTTPLPPAPRWPWQRRPQLATPPTISHHLVDLADRPEADTELVEHSTSGHPVVSFHRPLSGELSVLSRHDYTRPAAADGRWGWTIDSFSHWQSRPDLGSYPQLRGSAASHAGNEPWAELLTAALLSYRIHHQLTGEDIRPINKFAPRPPRR